MSEPAITCPKCGAAIKLNESSTAPLSGSTQPTDEQRLAPWATAILAMIASGHSYEQIVEAYPEFTFSDIFDAADEALKLSEGRLGMSSTNDHPRKTYSVEEIRRGHPTAYAPWTRDQDRLLRELVQQGLRVAEIAERMGRQRGGVSSRIRKLHLDAGGVDEGQEKLDAATAQKDGPP